MSLKDTVQTLLLAVAISLTVFVLATPLCIWIMGSAESCKMMICEIMIMRRPMAEPVYCEAWFDLFR